jgi:hypothetical protein
MEINCKEEIKGSWSFSPVFIALRACVLPFDKRGIKKINYPDPIFGK